MADYSDYNSSRKKHSASSASVSDRAQKLPAPSSGCGRRITFLVRWIILALLLTLLRSASCLSAEENKPPELPPVPSIEDFHNSVSLPEMPNELKNYLSGSDFG